MNIKKIFAGILTAVMVFPMVALNVKAEDKYSYGNTFDGIMYSYIRNYSGIDPDHDGLLTQEEINSVTSFTF